MPHLSHDLVQKLFSTIKNVVNMFLLMVLFYILQYIFDMDFVCSCRSGLHFNGVLYIAAPPLILTFVANIIEPFRQSRIFSNWGCNIHYCCDNYLCSRLLKFFIRYISMSAVWVSTVLFDGDWYFCLMTNLSKNQTGLPCIENLTYNEQRIKDAYKTDSLDIGFGVICAFLFFWNIFEWCGDCCMRKNIFKNWFQFKQDLCLPYYVTVYKDHLAEEVRQYLNEGLKNIAAERAKAICEPYLQAIKKQELLKNNTEDENDNGNNTVLEDWWMISASDFDLMKITETQ